MTQMLKYYKGQFVEYEIYKLVDFYDSILRKPTIPFKFESLEDNKKAHYMAFSMAETLSELGGLGLSANQIGLNVSVCAINMGNEIWTMFNPEIIEHSLIPSAYQEGCLSYPGLYLKIPRWETIKVKFQAINGKYVLQEFSGLTAVCVQHELDHLNGVLFTDKVSKIKLEQAKRKVKNNLKKMEKMTVKSKEETKEIQPSNKIVEQQQTPQIQILDSFAKTQQLPEKFVYKV